MEHPWRLTPAALPARSSSWAPPATTGSSTASTRSAAPTTAAAWSNRLERPWGWLAGGCHPNRDVMAAIAAAGFHVLELERFDFQLMPPLVRPHVLGVAQRPASRPSAQQAKDESTMNVLVIGAT